MPISLQLLPPLPSEYASRHPYPCLFENRVRTSPDPRSRYHPLLLSGHQDFHACMEHLLYKQEHEEWIRLNWALNARQTRPKDATAVVARLEEIEIDLELCARVILLPAKEQALAQSLVDGSRGPSPPIPADLVDRVNWTPDGLRPGWKAVCLRRRLYRDSHEAWLAERQMQDDCYDEEVVDRITYLVTELILYAQIILLNVKTSAEPVAGSRSDLVRSAFGIRKRNWAGNRRFDGRSDTQHVDSESPTPLLEDEDYAIAGK